jgi:hypothetical protein
MRGASFSPGHGVTVVKPSCDHNHSGVVIAGLVEQPNDQKHIEFEIQIKGRYKEVQLARQLFSILLSAGKKEQ